MTAGDFLTTAARRLRAAGIASARLDCLILLEDATGKDRAYLLAHPEYGLSDEQDANLRDSIARRAQHVPLAYIRGKAFFYGREFGVHEHVLVPRPETEDMITALKDLPAARATIADIGTGSGCIGITAALELPESTVKLYDVDPSALMTARQNAAAHRAPVVAAHADLLDGVDNDIDIILANLPYIPDAFPVSAAVRHEPAIALYAGTDGLDAYRALWRQLAARADRPEYILTESLVIQHAKNTQLAKAAGYRLTATRGLIQQFERV